MHKEQRTKVFELKDGRRFHAACFTEATMSADSAVRGLPVEHLYSTGKRGLCAHCNRTLAREF